MTGCSLVFLSATAAFAVFGGLHLEIASGRALDGTAPDGARLQTGTTIAASTINRDAKADRQEATSNAAEGRTIVFEHPDLRSTTVAVRVWESASVAKGRPAAKDRKAPSKQAVACEGPVSALTEIAKHLDAGRCLT